MPALDVTIDTLGSDPRDCDRRLFQPSASLTASEAICILPYMAGIPLVSLEIDQRQPRTTQVYGALKAAILEVRLKPGTPISENRICRESRVSRTPVREALIRLAQERLIDVFPQHGSFVSLICATKVAEGHFVRQTLELAMLKKAAERWSKADTEAAENILALQRAHAGARNYASFYREDERFHHAIAEVAGLRGVSRVIGDANTHLTRVRQLANPVEGHMEEALREHELILASLDAADTERAVAVLTQHLDRVFKTVKRLLQLHAEYFDDGTRAGYVAAKSDGFSAQRRASAAAG